MVFASDRPQGDRVECIQSMSKFSPGGIASALLRQRLTTHRLLERVRGKSREVNNHIYRLLLFDGGGDHEARDSMDIRVDL